MKKVNAQAKSFFFSASDGVFQNPVISVLHFAGKKKSTRKIKLRHRYLKIIDNIKKNIAKTASLWKQALSKACTKFPDHQQHPYTALEINI